MKKNINHKGIFVVIMVLMMLILCEFAFRLTLWYSKNFPFWRPDLAVTEHFYRELKLVDNSNISPTNDSLDILILGGSVVADEWRSKVARNLRDTLKLALKTDKIRYFNFANLGHTTVDNLYKLQSIPSKRFDLVIYYEGINETRFNNVPAHLFREDYGHVRWYHDIQLVKAHPEMRYTVFPFIIDLVGGYVSALFGKSYFMNDNPDAKFYAEGGDIKTTEIYKRNLKNIVELVNKRNEPLLLINFTYYVPERWRKSGFLDQPGDFAACDLASPIATWGTAPNVEKGILAHRNAMYELAESTPSVHYLDMNEMMPKKGENFCDICHLTHKGCKIFADSTANFILKNNILKSQF